MWPNSQFPADLVTFTEEILNEKLHFLCSVPANHYSKITMFFSNISNRSAALRVTEPKVTTENALIEIILELKVTMNQVVTKNPVLGISAHSWPAL